MASAAPGFATATPNATDWTVSTGNFTATHGQLTSTAVEVYPDTFEPFPRPSGYAPIGTALCDNQNMVYMAEEDLGGSFYLTVSVKNDTSSDCVDNYRLNFIDTN